MDAEVARRIGPVEADARTKIVDVLAAGAVQERLHDGIDLAVVADVFRVGVEIVAQPEVQRELRRHVPVVLREERQVVVVAVGQHQRTVGIVALQRDREQQVVPV